VSAHGCCASVTCKAEQPKEGMRTADGGPHPRSMMRRSAKAGGWIVPSAILVLMPKCPACVVAYIAIATGAGISVSMAAHLRLMVLALCIVTLIYVAAKTVLHRMHG
jgi:hypothetical protein